MRLVSNVPFVLVAGLFGGCVLGESSQTDESTSSNIARLSGAIFTTLPDGSRVDANIYASKDDVYLDGGPGNGAPQKAAGLPDGDYFFQVTDPSGKVLLSSDPILCREFHVQAAIITAVGPASCSHKTGLDGDHGALTVQLMPYDDTPNNGGEYKAWVTPVADYNLQAKQHFHGFVESDSKTDNYKVRPPEVPPPPPPACGNGIVESGEQCDDGNTANGDGCSSTCTIETPPPPPPPCCGNGKLESGEQCDDGNTANGDGCSSTCTIETPPPPPPCCGDGHVDAGEACDDGNTTSGDGCSSECTIETTCPPTAPGPARLDSFRSELTGVSLDPSFL